MNVRMCQWKQAGCGREQRMEEDERAREISKRLFSFHSSVRNWSGACEIIVSSFKPFEPFRAGTRVRPARWLVDRAPSDANDYSILTRGRLMQCCDEEFCRVFFFFFFFCNERIMLDKWWKRAPNKKSSQVLLFEFSLVGLEINGNCFFVNWFAFDIWSFFNGFKGYKKGANWSVCPF